MAQSPQGQRKDARTGGLPTVWALVPTFLVIVMAVYTLAAITHSRPVTDEVGRAAASSTATSTTGSGATSTALGDGAPFSVSTPATGSGATNATLDLGASTASSTPSATSSGIVKAHSAVSSTPSATAATPTTTTTAPPTTTTTTPPSSTTTTTTPVSTNPAPAAGMSLAFTAGFTGSSLDASVWDTCYEWYVAASGCTSYDTGETEWYLPAQDQVSGGALHLVATETPTQGTDANGAPKTYPYTSGMVTTFSSFNFTYGYVQVVARIPGGTGTWPALWLLPQNGSWPPEIDIMENYGTPNLMEATLHWGATDQVAYRDVTSPSNLSSGWHTYGLLWQPGSLTWYLDGQVVYTFMGSEVPSQPMYFLANLAINGPAAPSSSFDIQSVQIYQPA